MKNEEKTQRKKVWGVIGILMGFLALGGAFLSPWIAEAIDPPPKSVEEKAVDFTSKVAKAAKAKLLGREYEASVNEAPLPSRFVVPGIIALGMIAVGLGIVSLLSSEPRMIGAGAVVLGMSAVVVQWSLLFAGALLVILLVYVILETLGISV